MSFRPAEEDEYGEVGSVDDSPQEIRASRVANAPVATVWQHLISPSGTEALLGVGARLGSKGESWQAEDGAHGVLRSYHPMEQVRVSWHAGPTDAASLVDLNLVDEGDTTRLNLVHERLTADAPHRDLEHHWTMALEHFTDGLN